MSERVLIEENEIRGSCETNAALVTGNVPSFNQNAFSSRSLSGEFNRTFFSA